MNIIEMAVISIVNKIILAKDEFESDQRGVSSIVATVLLIVIVVALAALLWGFLSGWFADLFEGITDSAAGIGQ